MAVTRENHQGTDLVQLLRCSSRSLAFWLALAVALTSALAASSARAADAGSGADFAHIYALLETHCGSCHINGQADGPWSLNTPPSADHFPICLAQAGRAGERCATYHQLVDPPGAGIPAWIRPDDARGSEPYAQACEPEASFHIGHSLPEKLPDAQCERFLDWIEEGAPYG